MTGGFPRGQCSNCGVSGVSLRPFVAPDDPASEERWVCMPCFRDLAKAIVTAAQQKEQQALTLFPALLDAIERLITELGAARKAQSCPYGGPECTCRGAGHIILPLPDTANETEPEPPKLTPPERQHQWVCGKSVTGYHALGYTSAVRVSAPVPDLLAEQEGGDV